MFQRTEAYPAVGRLEARWREIRGELESLAPQGFAQWPEQDIYDGSWTVFGLYAFGQKIVENCTRCPVTTACIEAIPGMVTAGFSAMAPGTHIKPHRGYSGSVLRAHLGLVPAQDCALRVGAETRAWEEGKALVFDDTTEHEAWNHGERTRVVLLLDFKRDPAAPLPLDALPLWLLLGK
jgi:beta-hydroxylase